jgi:hypothetical protein
VATGDEGHTMTSTPDESVHKIHTLDEEPEWNPLEELRPITLPLAVSRGRASVTFRKWSGRERLAYEDALTQRMLVRRAGAAAGSGEDDEDDDDRTVAIGTLRLFAASLTVRGSSGFPNVRDGFLSGTREDVETDLLAITDDDTYREILELATKIQPLPSAGKSDDKSDAETKRDDDGDPSPGSSTPPATPTDVVVGSASLSE